MKFSQWLETQHTPNVLNLMLAVVNDPDDYDLRAILSDAFEENGLVVEADLMRRSDQEIFLGSQYSESVTWDDSGSDYETETEDVGTNLYDWESICRLVRDFGGEPSSSPITPTTGGGVWLTQEAQQDQHTGGYVSYSLSLTQANGHSLPSYINWMILKTGRIRGVK